MYCTVVQIRRATFALAVLASTVALAAPARAADVGTAGPSFDPTTAPTGQKPQSKLWFNDGVWWGVLYNTTAGGFQIYRDVDGEWTTTGTSVDSRDNVSVDALWDGTHLNAVSAREGATAAAGVQYRRFSYDKATQSYTRDVGPVTLTTYGVEAAVLDRDGAGRLWATWTHDAKPDPADLTAVDTKVEVAHAAIGDDASWSAPFVLPRSTTVTGDDISAIVRYAGHVGVMYSNQTTDWNFTWITHADGDPVDQWSAPTAALQGTELSDDHINLKALEGDPAGQVFAAVKTSLNAASDPLVELLVLDDAGVWRQHTVFTVADDPTRPQLELDPVRREIHVFATIGPCCTGGRITVKTTSLDNIAFDPGRGMPLMTSALDTHLNNVTTTKQPIDKSMPFLPLLAGDDTTHRYWQNTLALPAPPPPPPPVEQPPAPQPDPTPPAQSEPEPPAPEPVAVETPSVTPDPVIRAVLSALRLRPASFRRSSTVAFTLSTPALVTMRIYRASPRGRWVRVRTLAVVGQRGANTRALSARKLRPGRYRLVVSVPGRPAQRAPFRILR
ncbi:MAG TPA: hypothetical protein VGJ32_09390 [Solirubrobacteraceae bacterium]